MVDLRRMTGAVVRRARRAVVSRSAAARAARPSPEWSVSDPRGDLSEWWLDESRRVAHDLDRVVPGLVETDRPSVCIVCVTNRPEQADHVCDTVLRQSGVGPLRVVVVLNDGIGDATVFRDRLAGFDLDVVHLPPPTTLGACLNHAWGLAGTRYVAKIDDDDVYGPHYLRDAVRVLRWSAAAVVGKHTYLARLHGSGVTVLRFPGHEWAYSGFVAGGTIVADSDRIGSARFGDSTTGEDSAFLAAVERHGGLVLATSALDFVQARHTGNTWQVDEARFLRSARRLGSDDLSLLVAGA